LRSKNPHVGHCHQGTGGSNGKIQKGGVKRGRTNHRAAQELNHLGECAANYQADGADGKPGVAGPGIILVNA